MPSTPVEFLESRQRALAARLAEASVDLLLVASHPNIAYLSQFFGSAAFLLAGVDRLLLVSDARYTGVLQELSATVPTLQVDIVRPGEGSIEERLATAVTTLAPRRLGFEASHLSVAQHTALAHRLEEAGLAIEWVPLDGLVEAQRAVKDTSELAVLREAGRRLSDVSKCIIPNALAGVAERRLAAIVEWELRQKGFDKPAFDTIVASGPNAALPHHRAGDRVLVTGDVVVVDFGGMFSGYAVDMTRTVTIGPPSARQRRCWETVREAQRASFAAVQVGTPADQVDAAARRVIGAAGMGEAFSHGLGHGLGLEVHELPRLAKRRPGVAAAPLVAGMVFTLEPGVYFPGWGGVRIEDDVVLTASGPEWLTEPV